MRLQPLTISVADMRAQGLTIKVRYSGPLRFRFWLAKVCIRFAAWLVGGKADVQREGA